MSAIELPDHPVYAFVPIEDPYTGMQQIRIAVGGMDIAIGTSPVVLDIDRAMVVADRLNRPARMDPRELGRLRRRTAARGRRRSGLAA